MKNFSSILRSLFRIKSRTNEYSVNCTTENIANCQSSAEANTQIALDVSGFGKFNHKIIIVSGLVCMNVAFSLTCVALILPSAACDFRTTTIDKGRLSTGLIFGMLIGAYIWGCLADTMGRRLTLLNCTFIQACVDGLSSVIPYYWGVLVMRIVSGFALGGQSVILYTYLGEFQPTKYRKTSLSFMEIAWVLGSIAAPLLAWLIIPMEINADHETFFFHSWNLFVLVSSIPAWLIGIWLIFLPETPKYLSESGQEQKLSDVLTTIYNTNTGKSTEEYFMNLSNSGITSINQMIPKIENNKLETNKMRKFINMFYEQTLILTRPPYLARTVIVCLVMYTIFSSMFTLMLWFPELFERFADFVELNGEKQANVCLVSKKNSTFDEIMDVTSEFTSECNSHKVDTKVFIHTLIVGLACVPVAVIFPVIANRVEFKYCLTSGLVVCAATTIGLFFVTTSTESVILSCLFEAFVSASSTVMCGVVVEMFPTNLRTTAAALAALCARAGAIAGNMTFTYLIDNYCMELICILAGQLLLGGILAMFLPTK